MAIDDHQPSDRICMWDHEPWPCATARTLKEAAEKIRSEMEVGSYAYTSGWENAADLIDPEA